MNTSKNHTLTDAKIGERYTVAGIAVNDKEISDFLFTLGCYKGEEVTLVSRLSGSYVVSIKDSRYSIDKELAKAILI